MTHAPYPGERLGGLVAITMCRRLVDTARMLARAEFSTFHAKHPSAACAKCARAIEGGAS